MNGLSSDKLRLLLHPYDMPDKDEDEEGRTEGENLGEAGDGQEGSILFQDNDEDSAKLRTKDKNKDIKIEPEADSADADSDAE